MSQDQAKSFIEGVTRDPGLRQAAMTELEKPTASTSQRLIDLGARHGLTFNEAELRTAWEEERQAMEKGELSDADLNGATGGFGFIMPTFISGASRDAIVAIGNALATAARK